MIQNLRACGQAVAWHTARKVHAKGYVVFFLYMQTTKARANLQQHVHNAHVCPNRKNEKWRKKFNEFL
jgi:hypothetical protein